MSRINLTAIFLLSLLLLSCTSGGKTGFSLTNGFRASGSDPAWSVDMNFETGETHLVVEGEKSFDHVLSFPPPTRGRDSSLIVYSVPFESYMVEVTIERKVCEDSRLGETLPYTATVILSDFRSRVEESRLTGCGRYTGLGELSRFWRLVKLDGEEVTATRPDERLPNIQFLLTQGRINGDGGCNYFTGEITIEGDSVRIGPIPSTKMACPRIGRESSYIGALREKAHEIVMENGKLILRSDFHELEFRRE